MYFDLPVADHFAAVGIRIGEDVKCSNTAYFLDFETELNFIVIFAPFDDDILFSDMDDWSLNMI
jgi:hypothetical protein